MGVVSRIGILSEPQVISLESASDWAFLDAFVGLGFETQLNGFRSIGYTPVLVVLVGLGVVTTSMLLPVRTLF